MAVKGYFYNAVNGDRVYNGNDMNKDKAPFYKEGVCFGHLQVTASAGMKIKVDGGEKTGYAYLNYHTIHNNTVLELTIGQANGTMPRIDRVILRNDEAERTPSILVIEGAYSNDPTPPELTNNVTIQEKCLAEIYVAAGTVEITQADITDTRADTDLCGYIASQFQDVDFSQFATQFSAWYEQYRTTITNEFDTWFQDIKKILSEEAAGNLLDMIRQLQTDIANIPVVEVNNTNIVTEPGIALDARQANPEITGTMANKTKNLEASITTLNSKLGTQVTMTLSGTTLTITTK